MKKIELATAKKMVDHYRSTRKTLIDKTHNINDTESIWIPVDKFKDFIGKLPGNATGVRIYFAAYDHNEPNYPNRTTAIFMGTVENGNEHVDAMKNGSELLGIEPGMEPFNKTKQCPPDC